MNMHEYKEELVHRGLERRSSTIIDILAIEDIVIVMSDGGLAAAFCRVTNKLQGFLNVSSSEWIQALFYNKYQESILIVSIDEPNGYPSPICRELSIQCVLRKKLNHICQIFKNEDFSWPGYLGVDMINGLVLIKNRRLCRVFDLKRYSFKYEFCAASVERVLCRYQILLLTYETDDGKLALEFRSADNGEILSSLSYNIARGGRMNYIDVISRKLIIQQEYRNLQMVDLSSMKRAEVQIGDCLLVPLLRRNAFITFQQESTEVRDLNGEIIKSIEEHVLYDIYSVLTNVWFSRGEDIFISACRSEGEIDESVRLTSVDSGILLATIDPKTKVMSMCYNDDRHEIYVGTLGGRVLVWSM